MLKTNAQGVNVDHCRRRRRWRQWMPPLLLLLPPFLCLACNTPTVRWYRVMQIDIKKNENDYNNNLRKLLNHEGRFDLKKSRRQEIKWSTAKVILKNIFLPLLTKLLFSSLQFGRLPSWSGVHWFAFYSNEIQKTAREEKRMKEMACPPTQHHDRVEISTNCCWSVGVCVWLKSLKFQTALLSC